MDAGLAYLQDLLEIAPRLPTGDKIKAESAREGLVDALPGEEGSFLTSLAGQAGDQCSHEEDVPAVRDSFLYETEEKGTSNICLFHEPGKKLPLSSGSIHGLEPDLKNNKMNTVKSGANIPENSTHVNEFNPNKEGALLLELTSTQNKEGAVQSVADRHSMEPLTEGRISDYNRGGKSAYDNFQKSETLPLPSIMKDKESQPKAGTNMANSEENNLKLGNETIKNPLLDKIYEKISSDMNRYNQLREAVSDKGKVSLEDKSDMQKEGSHNIEKGDTERHINRTDKGRLTLTTNQNSDHTNRDIKTATAKTEPFNQALAGSKIFKINSTNGEEGRLSTDSQLTEKNFEAIFQTKETQPVQKPLQADVMSQIIQKAIVNLKNGHSSIIIRLRPEALGQLRMQIATESNHVMIKIFTEAPLVKEIIESNVIQLKTELQNQGLEMEKFDVSVGHGSKQNEDAAERLSFSQIVNETDEKESEEELIIDSKETMKLAEQGNGDSLIDFFA